MFFRRSQIVYFLFALVVLRLVIGYHFYHEGISKIQDGNFTAEPFFKSARGPLAPLYHALLDDEHGRIVLCVTPNEIESDRSLDIDTDLTFAIWSEEFVPQAIEKFRLDQTQTAEALALLAKAKAQLSGFLQANREPILAWAQGQSRLEGFERDGVHRQATAEQVESLRQQVETIRMDRQRQASSWFSYVEAVWDEFEAGVNELGGAYPSSVNWLNLHRPFRPRNSLQDLIDRFIPWFDTVIGALLILGLFTRLAGIAAICLLMGIVATQPPWLSGSADTFYQWIELAGLFVLVAAGAGRFAGLDYFLQRKSEPE